MCLMIEGEGKEVRVKGGVGEGMIASSLKEGSQVVNLKVLEGEGRWKVATE